MPASALEWSLTLAVMPFYLWYGYTTGLRIGYWLLIRLFGEEEVLAMTCSHPYCWIYTDREPDKVPFYMLATSRLNTRKWRDGLNGRPRRRYGDDDGLVA